MARLTHLAIASDDPAGLGEWYRRWFGFEELNRTADGAVYLSDGYFNLGFLKRGDDAPKLGLHHIGFAIESIVEIERNLEDFEPNIRIEQAPATDPYAQYRIRDSEGVIVDLSEQGFGVDGAPRLPAVRHVAMFNRYPRHKSDFYQQVLGMRDATRSDEEIYGHLRMTAGAVPSDFQRSTSPFCGDGFINVAMLGRDMTEEEAKTRAGLNHFGILVRDPLDLVRRMGQMGANDRPEDTRPPERQVEYGVRDPDGNRIDVSGRKGWKVDVDLWARVED
jgi:catechol 2,3-dioxygenase-like lactoylglutathione lyase family enzyme